MRVEHQELYYLRENVLMGQQVLLRVAYDSQLLTDVLTRDQSQVRQQHSGLRE